MCVYISIMHVLHALCHMLTAKYGRHPISVLAKELTSSPAIPKSHSLISPLLLMSIFEGLTSKMLCKF